MGFSPLWLPCLSHPSQAWDPQECPWFLSHHKKSRTPVSSPLCSAQVSPAFPVVPPTLPPEQGSFMYRAVSPPNARTEAPKGQGCFLPC